MKNRAGEEYVHHLAQGNTTPAAPTMSRLILSKRRTLDLRVPRHFLGPTIGRAFADFYKQEQVVTLVLEMTSSIMEALLDDEDFHEAIFRNRPICLETKAIGGACIQRVDDLQMLASLPTKSYTHIETHPPIQPIMQTCSKLANEKLSLETLTLVGWTGDLNWLIESMPKKVILSFPKPEKSMRWSTHNINRFVVDCFATPNESPRKLTVSMRFLGTPGYSQRPQLRGLSLNSDAHPFDDRTFDLPMWLQTANFYLPWLGRDVRVRWNVPGHHNVVSQLRIVTKEESDPIDSERIVRVLHIVLLMTLSVLLK